MKIFIAGASGGIGGYLADRLSACHEVYGSYRSRVPGADVEYQMDRVDIGSGEEVERWISANASEDDDLALIYCVGVNYNCMMHKADSDKWEDVIDSNLIGVQRVLRQIIPLMRKRRFGRIILFSSVVPQMGVMGTSAYAASKSALWGLAKAVAKENASYGITINTLNLGYFDIGMIEDVPDNVLEKIIEEIPMKMLGDPGNIYNAVDFLLKSDYITGSCVDINGGLV